MEPDNAREVPIPDYRLLQFLKEEYTQLFSEIRAIHARRLQLAQYLFYSFVALLTYVFAGIVFYVQSRGEKQLAIPESIAWSYSALGLTLVAGEYLFIHNAFHFFAPSKKQTVRYWKAIHAIRSYFVTAYPYISPFILMPAGSTATERPHMSKRWGLGILVPPVYHLTFYLLAALLFSPLLCTYNPNHGLEYPVLGRDVVIESLFWLWPFLLLLHTFSGRAIRRYWQDMVLASSMTDSSVWVDLKDLPDYGFRSLKIFSGMGHLLLVLSSFYLWEYYFTELTELPYWYFVLFGSFALSIALHVINLVPHGLRLRTKGLKIAFDIAKGPQEHPALEPASELGVPST